MARMQTCAGHPVRQYVSPNRGGAMSGHRGLVLHIAQGSYEGTISWQMNPDQRYADGTAVTTSSTFVVGRETGQIAQMVDSDAIAWCQRDGSRTWLSIELAGFAPQGPSAWQVEVCAQLLVWSHRLYGHAVANAANESEYGLGHHSMDREALGVEWGHEACPGAGVIAAKDAIVRRAQAIILEETVPTAAEIAAAVWAYQLEDPASTTTPKAKKAAGTYVRYNDVVSRVGARSGVLELVEEHILGGPVDTAAIVAQILAGLDPQRIADLVVAALPADQAKRTADELAARLAG